MVKAVVAYTSDLVQSHKRIIARSRPFASCFYFIDSSTRALFSEEISPYSNIAVSKILNSMLASESTNIEQEYASVFMERIIEKMKLQQGVSSSQQEASSSSGLLILYSTHQSANLQHVCGQIYSMNTRPHRQWVLKPLSGYATVLTFFKLNTLYSKQCELNAFILSCQREGVYCGFIPPWKDNCLSATINLTLKVNHRWPLIELNVSYYIAKHFYSTLHMIGHFRYRNAVATLVVSHLLSTMNQRLTMYIYNHYLAIIRLIYDQDGKYV